MVEFIEQKLILKDSRLVLPPINGKVLKVYIKTNKPLSQTKVILTSNEFEYILDTTLDNNVNLFYPRNFIPSQFSDFNIDDYFYVNGPLGLEVKDLEQEGIIETIRVFYE